MHELGEKNKQAWDALYGGTEELVWGQEAVGFLQALLPALSLGPSPRILDAAAGEGRNLPLLLQLGAVTACDSSPKALGKIRPAIREKVEVVQCDLSSTPFPAERFDLILLADVIETLPEPGPVLQELWRILKRGGMLLCNIPGCDDGIFGSGMAPHGEAFLYRERFFFRFMGEAEAIQLLESAGFSLLRHELLSWLEPPHPGFRQEEHCHRSRVFLAEKRP